MAAVLPGRARHESGENLETFCIEVVFKYIEAMRKGDIKESTRTSGRTPHIKSGLFLNLKTCRIARTAG